jgi:SUKH-3 immunity protein
MASYPQWSDETEAQLTAAGWHLGRRETARVIEWRARLSAFDMSAAAERALEEFGGIRVEAGGSGLECARWL